MRGEDYDVVLRGLHEIRSQRRAQARIHDGAEERAAARLAGAITQARIVGQDGADSGEERVGFVAQPLDGVVRSLASDRGSAAGFLGDLAVEGECGFQGDERELGANPAGEIFIQVLRLFFSNAAD